VTGAGDTRLLAALRTGDLALVQSLTARRRLRARFDGGLTPLMAVAHAPRHRVDIAQVLLARGDDVLARDNGGWTALRHAAEAGAADLARFLLDHGAYAGEEDLSGGGPLWAAVRTGDVELLRLLLERHAPANALNRYGQPVAFALISSRADPEVKAEMLATLLQAGAHVQARGGDGSTLLLQACTANDFSLVRALLAHRADTREADSRGATALHRVAAVSSGGTEIVDALLDAGAEADRLDNAGATPLARAAESGNLAVATILLRRGAARSAGTLRPLALAAGAGHRAIVETLLAAGPPAESEAGMALCAAATQHHADIGRLLIEHGADVRAREPGEGASVLALALGWYDAYIYERRAPPPLDLAFVAQLLERGADPNAAARSGVTPIFFCSDTRAFALLIAHGADVRRRDATGQTALHYAADVDGARRLLDHGADPSAASNDGTTPLHWSMYRRHLEVAALLVSRGADPNARHERGETPLLAAARMQDPAPLVRIALQAPGVDVDTRAPDGWTALMRVAARGDEDAVAALVAAGADAALRTNEGWTAAECAARWGQPGSVELLGGSPEERAGAHLVAAARDGTALPRADVAAPYLDRALGMTVYRGDAAASLRLLRRGADPNAPIATGMGHPTPPWDVLTHAVHAGRDEIVKELLARGARVAAIEILRRFARENGHARVLRRLEAWTGSA
jgi:ankyrin repeat protein